MAVVAVCLCLRVCVWLHGLKRVTPHQRAHMEFQKQGEPELHLCLTGSRGNHRPLPRRETLGSLLPISAKQEISCFLCCLYTCLHHTTSAYGHTRKPKYKCLLNSHLDKTCFLEGTLYLKHGLTSLGLRLYCFVVKLHICWGG